MLLKPGYHKYHYRNGVVNIYLGQYHTAIKSFRKAAENVIFSVNALEYIETAKQFLSLKTGLIPVYETLNVASIIIDHPHNHKAYNPLFYDNEDDNLLIFSVDAQTLRSVILKYDINQDKYIAIQNQKDQNDLDFYKLIPDGSLYIKHDHIFIQMNDDEVREIYYDHIQWSLEVVYSEFMNEIYSFNVYKSVHSRNETDTKVGLWYCDLNRMESKWMNYNEFPCYQLPFCCCMAFGHLLFMFIQDLNGTYNEIWCYDVWFDKKWIKCKYVFPSLFNKCKAIVDKQRNFVHFMFIQYDHDQTAFHFKMDLYQLIPSTLLTLYQKKYNLLLNKYVNAMNESDILSCNVSVDLVCIISRYFPVFA